MLNYYQKPMPNIEIADVLIKEFKTINSTSIDALQNEIKHHSVYRAYQIKNKNDIYISPINDPLNIKNIATFKLLKNNQLGLLTNISTVTFSAMLTTLLKIPKYAKMSVEDLTLQIETLLKIPDYELINKLLTDNKKLVSTETPMNPVTLIPSLNPFRIIRDKEDAFPKTNVYEYQSVHSYTRPVEIVIEMP